MSLALGGRKVGEVPLAASTCPSDGARVATLGAPKMQTQRP